MRLYEIPIDHSSIGATTYCYCVTQYLTTLERSEPGYVVGAVM